MSMEEDADAGRGLGELVQGIGYRAGPAPRKGERRHNPIRPEPVEDAGAVAVMGAGRSPVACEPEPEWSDKARDLILRFAYPHPDVGVEWHLVTKETKAECEAAWAAVEDRTRAATLDDWIAFLHRVGMGTANAPLTKMALEAVSIDAHEKMGYVPVGVLSETWRECGLLKYFPKPHDLNQIMRRRISAAISHRNAVQRIKDAEPGGKKRAEPTAEERATVAGVAATVKARMDELDAKTAAEKRASVQSLPDVSLTPEQITQSLRNQLVELDGALRKNPQNYRVAELRKSVWQRIYNMERVHMGERGFQPGDLTTFDADGNVRAMA